MRSVKVIGPEVTFEGGLSGNNLSKLLENVQGTSEKKGAPTSYFMIAAPARIRVNCDLRHVNVVLCCDPKAFTHTNPLDGMSEGGCLVWESEEEGKDAWERLPLWARKQIIDKKIRVIAFICLSWHGCAFPSGVEYFHRLAGSAVQVA